VRPAPAEMNVGRGFHLNLFPFKGLLLLSTIQPAVDVRVCNACDPLVSVQVLNALTSAHSHALKHRTDGSEMKTT
jgi:hypothetical protein